MTSDSKLVWAAVGGLVLAAWDVSMDPAMSSATIALDLAH